METAAQQDRQTAQVIARNLNKLGVGVSAEDITPQTAATAIPRTKELEEAGAEISGEDITHLVGETVGEMTTGASKVRVARSSSFWAKLKERVLRKKKPDEEVLIK
ncbi:hypothetical protein HY386_01780 [Candidatus Daviesbacteria bacterium]|nr:hypothetical protein [Candidatus Daviesbacteria bacterium]